MLRCICLLVAFCWLQPAQSFAANPQNLMDVYQQALAHDPVLASAKSANLAAQEQLEQGKALFRPSVSLSANANHSETDLKYNALTIFGKGSRESFQSYGAGVNVIQPIYRKQNNAQLEQSKSFVSQADKQLLLTQQNLIVRCAQAYFDMLVAQDKVDLILAQKTAITKQLEQAKANFDVGNSTITDVNEAQARFDLIVAQEIAASNDVEVKRRTIQSITGDSPQKLAPVAVTLKPAMPTPNDMEAWVGTAEWSSVTLSIQQQAFEIAAQEVERQNAGNLPTLDAVGSYTSNYANGAINGLGADTQNATIGLQLQMQLYQGGAISSRVREAVAKKQKAQDDVEAARRQAELDTRQAYLNLSSSVAQVSAYEQALISSQSQLDSTNLGYEVGVRTSVDVLNAQQQYFSAKRDLLQARYTYLISQLKLKLAVGQLNEGDLATLNQTLSQN
jgi:outer membrane protein